MYKQKNKTIIHNLSLIIMDLNTKINNNNDELILLHNILFENISIYHNILFNNKKYINQ